ncbi:hypothetical protein BKA93DRAFT_731910 [Sparassis latifolia]
MLTPTSSKARVSGIPTPGKSTNIPTPGRPRSASTSAQFQTQSHDEEYISKAFADAIRANDPAQHRYSRTSDVSVPSLSPSSATHPSHSGRRSVTGRPSSVASSSSAVSSGPSRTPATNPRSARPPSRQSDVFAQSSGRAGRSFEVGDNVRIESLGFEGTLRYLGEIDGKPGLWAGVELSGGFAYKGKNNGTVNGKQYFVCPRSCGVFVASTKLSLPTVGFGTISRPSSVASTRSMQSGRKTPSISMSNGRVTPCTSNGRVTPSAQGGRRTPGIVPPSRIRSAGPDSSGNPITPMRGAPLQNSITPGSRASRYVGMTAKQLSSRGAGTRSPPQKSSGANSPTRFTGLSSAGPGHLSSPTRGLSSPFNTPKAISSGRTSNVGMGIPSTTPNKSRAILSTPRARVPSSIAMPPPASPSGSLISSRSISLDDPPFKERGNGSLTDLELNGKALQDKIAELISGKPSGPVSRPESSASVTSSAAVEFQTQIERMQTQLETLEGHNQRLRTATSVHEREAQEAAERMQKLLSDHKQDSARIIDLEASVRTNERLLGERDSAIEALERAAQQTAMDIDKIKSEAEARLRDVQSKLDDKEALVNHLKESIEFKEGRETENDAVLRAKDAEIALLGARVEKAYLELEDERRELGGQVDELRKAGQETIALYEERLSTSESKRFDLEDEITSLQDQLRKSTVSPSPSAIAHHTSSAVEIDNEALRDQVQHLQKKILTLEDRLEDAHLALEREDVAVRERMTRYKEREDGMREELQGRRDEVERLLKSEEGARQRVEEMVEALRENTVALENARAEIEGLRSEIAASHSPNMSGGSSGSSERLAEVAQRTASERGRLMDEIVQLKQRLAAQPGDGSSSLARTGGAVHDLAEAVNALKSEKATLQQLCDDREAELATERDVVADLRLLVEERSAELETIRKKFNRELPVNGLDAGKGMPGSPFKYDIAAARDEITGLKHIVQELQKENSAAGQRNKVLESENRLLLSETEQLREDLKALEENVEQSILREEQALLSGEDSSSVSASGDAVALQKSLKEVKVKYETDLEQLRKKQMDAEMKTARTIHDLNKEIGELETLIESKIYREDELERELERLKEKLARSQKKTSKTELREDGASKPEVGASSTEVCEICERPGHDIFTCDLLKGEGGRMGGGSSSGGEESELVCEDCEGRGHVAANCPHSLDVF